MVTRIDQLSDADISALLLDLSGRYNVIHYLADKTGATDSSSAFNAAATAANAAGGGIVWIPAGTYLISNIDILDGVYFVGAGIAATVLNVVGGSSATQHMFNRSSTAVMGFGGISNCSLIGGEDKATASSYNGIHLRDSVGFISQGDTQARWTISNCLISGFHVGIHGTEDDRHLALDNNWIRECEVGLFTTHHTEFIGQNDFRRCTYGIGHGSIVSGGPTGLFDQNLSNLKINTNYGIWPITIDDSNVIQTNHDIGGETLEPLRACTLVNSIFSCDIAAICIGDETAVDSCQFVADDGQVEALIVVGCPDSINSAKNWSITNNKLRTIDTNGISRETDTTTDIFGNTIDTGGTVTGITLSGSNPVSVAMTSHDCDTGDRVRFQDVSGTTELNGNWYTITRTDADNFTLDGTDSSNFTAWTSGGTMTRGRTLNGAMIVIDVGNAEVRSALIANNTFDCDSATNKTDCIRVQDGQSSLIGTNSPSVWQLQVQSNIWRLRPESSGSYGHQFFVMDGPEFALNLSCFAHNQIEIHTDENDSTYPVIKVRDTSNTFATDYINNIFRVNVSGKYAIEAELEDGTVIGNRIFQGAGTNFTGIEAQSNISGNFTDGVRDAGDNVYNA